MKKHAIFIGLGDYYGNYTTGYTSLPFVYQNIVDLSTFLLAKNWKTHMSLLDQAANRKNIIAKIEEVILDLKPDDWLLIYYTGHAEKNTFQKSTYPLVGEYCVSFSSALKYNSIPPLSDFLTDTDYKKIISSFISKAPSGHLITILDCCYANGIVDNYMIPAPFHTVMAASEENVKAYYGENSLFFTALKKSWGEEHFQAISDKVIQEMLLLEAPQKCRIQISQTFSVKSF